MSIVIIGGHDRMVRRYQQICMDYKCRVKIFTQMSARLREQIGSPDILVVFVNTVSHKMVRCALEEAERQKIEVIRCQTSSKAALVEALERKLK